MNWIKIIQFSAILFVSTFLIGVAQGFVIGVNNNYLSLATYIGTAVYLVIEFVIYVYLAKSLDTKPFQHAFMVFILTSVVGFILLWLVSGSFIISAAMPEVVLSILALVVGTSVGVNLRPRKVGKANA